MIQVSPKTIAFGSLALIVFGIITSVLFSALFPSADALQLLSSLLMIMGAIGLVLSYIFVSVNFWDAGNRVVSVALLALPLLGSQAISSTTSDMAEFLGVCIGILLISYIIIILGSMIKKQVRHLYLKEAIP